jgi:hypothetical protein
MTHIYTKKDYKYKLKNETKITFFIYNNINIILSNKIKKITFNNTLKIIIPNSVTHLTFSKMNKKNLKIPNNVIYYNDKKNIINNNNYIFPNKIIELELRYLKLFKSIHNLTNLCILYLFSFLCEKIKNICNNIKILKLKYCNDISNIFIPTNTEKIYFTDCFNIINLIIPNNLKILHLLNCDNITFDNLNYNYDEEENNIKIYKLT